MTRQRAIAEDGPLEGVLNLTVEADDDDWPLTVHWDGPERGQRQLYRWKTVSHGPSGGVPVYEFVRALNSPGRPGYEGLVRDAATVERDRGLTPSPSRS